MSPNLLDLEQLLFYMVALISATTFGYGFQRFFGEAFSKDAPDEVKFSFNPLASLSIIGTAVFLLTGFGWGRQIEEDLEFKHHKLGVLIISFMGPFSNIVMALTAAYVKEYLWSDQVINALVEVNINFFCLHIIPLPPLFASRFIQAVLPRGHEGAWRLLCKIGPWILLGAALAEKVGGIPIISALMSVPADAVSYFVYY